MTEISEEQKTLLNEVNQACRVMAFIYDRFDEKACYELVDGAGEQTKLWKKWKEGYNSNFAKFYFDLSKDQQEKMNRWIVNNFSSNEIKSAPIPDFPVNKQVFLNARGLSKVKEHQRKELAKANDEATRKQFEQLHILRQNNNRPTNHVVHKIKTSTRNAPARDRLTLGSYMAMARKGL